MSVESGRTNYGMTDRGAVQLIERQSFSDDGEKKVYSYEIRHGAHTVLVTPNKKAAATAAEAIVAAAPAPPTAG